MKRLAAAWATWVAIWSHLEHPRSQALVRVLLAMVMLWDFLWIGALDLVVPLFAPEAGGGWGRVLTRDAIPWAWQVLPATPSSAWLLWGLTVTSLVAVLLGAWTRVAALAFVLLSAQLANTLDAADRGIDMMVRNVMLLMVFSHAHRTWSFDAWRATGSWRGDGQDVPAWPRHLLILQLVVMYTVAGVSKLGAGWTPMGGFSALYVILQDAAVARFDWSWIGPLYPLTQLSTAITILWEYSAPVVVLLFWYRHTHDRPGRLRALANRYPPHLVWLSVGVVFHVLIAITLNLGIFPFAMLALYPCFVHPDSWWWVPARSSESAPHP